VAPKLVFQPVAIAAETDSDGRLVFADDQLAAILVRLDDEFHAAQRGAWFLEVGFGALAPAAGEKVFSNLDEATVYIQRALSHR
jgi:hypothetical protein